MYIHFKEVLNLETLYLISSLIPQLSVDLITDGFKICEKRCVGLKDSKSYGRGLFLKMGWRWKIQPWNRSFQNK
jgi:hypothetical protein